MLLFYYKIVPYKTRSSGGAVGGVRLKYLYSKILLNHIFVKYY